MDSQSFIRGCLKQVEEYISLNRITLSPKELFYCECARRAHLRLLLKQQLLDFNKN